MSQQETHEYQDQRGDRRNRSLNVRRLIGVIIILVMVLGIIWLCFFSGFGRPRGHGHRAIPGQRRGIDQRSSGHRLGRVADRPCSGRDSPRSAPGVPVRQLIIVGGHADGVIQGLHGDISGPCFYFRVS
jgi:hypothetical protein